MIVVRNKLNFFCLFDASADKIFFLVLYFNSSLP